MKNQILTFIISMFIAMTIQASENLIPFHKVSNTLSVDGIGSLSVSPDVSVVALTVLTRAESAKLAQDENAIQTKRLSNSLIQKYNLRKGQITTSGFTISADRNPEDPNLITGYTVRHSLLVRVFFVEKIGELLDLAIMSGATTIDFVQFELKDQKKYELNALKIAMNDARLKADAIANSIGRKIIRVIKVTEGQYSIENEKQADEREIGTEIFPSPVNITLSLSVTFEF